MKYVVFRKKSAELTIEHPVVFSNHLVHADVAGNLTNPINGVLAGYTPVSAGEVNFMNAGLDMCSGRSSTLDLDSRPEEDSRLILLNDYGVGMS
jgi:hypothetical protein